MVVLIFPLRSSIRYQRVSYEISAISIFNGAKMKEITQKKLYKCFIAQIGWESTE